MMAERFDPELVKNLLAQLLELKHADKVFVDGNLIATNNETAGQSSQIKEKSEEIVCSLIKELKKFFKFGGASTPSKLSLLIEIMDRLLQLTEKPK